MFKYQFINQLNTHYSCVLSTRLTRMIYTMNNNKKKKII